MVGVDVVRRNIQRDESQVVVIHGDVPIRRAAFCAQRRQKANKQTGGFAFGGTERRVAALHGDVRLSGEPLWDRRGFSRSDTQEYW